MEDRTEAKEVVLGGSDLLGGSSHVKVSSREEIVRTWRLLQSSAEYR